MKFAARESQTFYLTLDFEVYDSCIKASFMPVIKDTQNKVLNPLQDIKINKKQFLILSIPSIVKFAWRHWPQSFLMVLSFLRCIYYATIHLIERTKKYKMKIQYRDGTLKLQLFFIFKNINIFFIFPLHH